MMDTVSSEWWLSLPKWWLSLPKWWLSLPKPNGVFAFLEGGISIHFAFDRLRLRFRFNDHFT